MEPPEGMSPPVLRIIDANLDRIGEGLRVLEDLARFGLNDADLARRLKEARHSLLTTGWPSPQQLLQARDTAGDVSINLETADQQLSRDLPATAVANARRVQEALRVIEEMAAHAGLSVERFRRARFELYELEQTLFSRLGRQDKTSCLRGLYAIIDPRFLKGRGHTEVARQIIQGGATTIQLRDKTTSKKDLLPIARELRNLCAEHNVLFIINDHLDLALATGADGLHLGQDDLPVKEARRLLAIDQILGISTRTVEQANNAADEGADYIAVGSMYPTTSKESAEVVGLERLRQIRAAVKLPIVAIGGITAGNAAAVIAADADAVAVISAILSAGDITTATQEIMSNFEAEK